MKLTGGDNLCRGCDQNFVSVKQFDQHRVGVHAYDFREGLRMEPPVEDGRRCLDVEEMRALARERNERGRWFDPVILAAARESFGREMAART